MITKNPEQMTNEELIIHQPHHIKKIHNYRWTTIENQFTRKKNRLFDELPPA